MCLSQKRKLRRPKVSKDYPVFPDKTFKEWFRDIDTFQEFYLLMLAIVNYHLPLFALGYMCKVNYKDILKGKAVKNICYMYVLKLMECVKKTADILIKFFWALYFGEYWQVSE